MAYNSTIFRIRGDRLISACVAEVDGEGRILRSNALQCTGAEGTPAYEARLMSLFGDDRIVVEPDTRGYRRFLTGDINPDDYVGKVHR
jgi:hypothetical protein